MIARINRSAAGIAVGITLMLAPALGFAAGPLAVFEPGQPYVWHDDGQSVAFHIDPGPLGTLSAEDAADQARDAFAVWTDVPSAVITYVEGPLLPEDIDATNYGPLFFDGGTADGLSPIVFDADGAIFTDVFGPDAADFILGFAGPQVFDETTGEILEGFSFMNGRPLISDLFPFSEEDMLKVQIHEFGHFGNLAHTVVNGQVEVFLEPAAPEPGDSPTLPDDFATEIMYPFAVDNTAFVPQPDDVASLSALYPADDFAATTGSISGTIFSAQGTPVTGVNVIARNVADPFGDAVSAISSDQTPDYSPGAPFVGTYTLRNLTPGASYVVYVDRIVAGGFSTPPSGFAVEEYWNGANETADDSDDPFEQVPIVAVAGATVDGIDFHLAPFTPGPLPIADETALELPLPFAFEMCGQSYESVFVHDNGFLMFGGSTPVSFIPSAEELLATSPRIAPLWTDLNPSAGGIVSFEQTDDTFTVSFDEVPEFPVTGAVSFSVTLRASGRFDFEYGQVGDRLLESIGGYSCGGGVTTGDEPASDLTDLPDPIVVDVGGEPVEIPTNARLRAVYELLTAEQLDLDGFGIHWGKTRNFSAPETE